MRGPLRRAGATRSSCATAASSRPVVRRASASRPQRCVLAAGGFESNREWLREAWGVNERGEHPADNFLIRGTRFNTGVLLRFMIDAGADTIGDPTQAHMVAIDARAPLYDGGICTRIDCVSLGVVVNREAERFYDEGEDFWPKRYAIWGRLVAQAARPDRLLDHRRQGGRALHAAGVSRRARRTPCRSWPRASSSTNALHADGDRLQRRLPARHLRPHGARRLPHRRPRRRPRRTGPCRSTRRRSTATRCGRASRSPTSASRSTTGARALRRTSRARNLFVAGEMMAGNVLGQGYTAGVGMTIGTAFGRIAGTQAAARPAIQKEADTCSSLRP